MKTIKLLSFFIVATVIFSSCDAIADTLAKDVEGSTKINFTSTGKSLSAPNGLQKANNVLNPEYVEYDKPMSTTEIDTELAKVSLTRENLRSITLTEVEFTLPNSTDASRFAGAKLYVDNVLTAQQEGTITGSTLTMAIKNSTSLLNAVNNGGNIKITTTTQLPANIVVNIVLYWRTRVSIIATR